jgi:hypothetical protein
MATIDLKRVYPDYQATKDPALVEVPARPYLMVDGTGDPNTSEAYTDAVATLYPVAYGIRKAIKDATGVAYTVMPLESLWWTDDGRPLELYDRSNWCWTAMICQPDDVTPELAAEVVAGLTKQKKLTAGWAGRLEVFEEGLAAQILHYGPYADEEPTIARLHEFIVERSYSFSGKHHEIYLTDPRRSLPEKNRTIIRQPVRR